MKLALLLIAIGLPTVNADQRTGRAHPARSHSRQELELVTNYELSKEPLSTDKVNDLDPGELNPHRQRWILERSVKLRGLRTEAKATGGFGVHAEAIEANIRGWARSEGPWFHPLADFPCTEEPQPGFATPEGAQQAAQEGAQNWESILSAARDHLRIRLARIDAPKSTDAFAEAKQVLADWSSAADRDWRSRGRTLAREAEWKSYLEKAKAQGLCHGQKPHVEFSWRQEMEPLPPGPPPFRVLARAPARRWNGMYSVRLTVHVGATRALSGQFLLDSGAPKSIFSPEWLKGQGVLPAWIEIPRAGPERAVFSAGRGVAKRALIEGVEFGGLKLPLSEVLLYDTELFAPPENLATCCDGVIGMDVLRHLVVELRPGPPTEVIIWPRENFRSPYAAAAVWLETGLNSELQASSDECLSRPGGSVMPEIEGLSWNTGSEGDLEIHLPWQSEVRNRKVPWEVHCAGGVQLASGVLPNFPRPDEARLGNGMLDERDPGATAGMALLGRGSMILDLPHGRIWFPQPALGLPIRENRTGLALYFDYSQGERVLKVGSVRPTPLIRPLLQEGLQPGDQVLEVDQKPADESDLWEIDQRLGGAFGPSVQLKWKHGAGVRQAKIALGAP